MGSGAVFNASDRPIYNRPQVYNLPNGLREAADGRGFVVVHLKDGVKLRDLQQVFDALAQTEQLQLPPMVGDRGKAGNELADAGAVDIRHLAQVQQHFLMAGGGQVADGVAKSARALTESDPSTRVHYGHVAYLTGRSFNAHFCR